MKLKHHIKNRIIYKNLHQHSTFSRFMCASNYPGSSSHKFKFNGSVLRISIMSIWKRPKIQSICQSLGICIHEKSAAQNNQRQTISQLCISLRFPFFYHSEFVDGLMCAHSRHKNWIDTRHKQKQSKTTIMCDIKLSLMSLFECWSAWSCARAHLSTSYRLGVKTRWYFSSNVPLPLS